MVSPPQLPLLPLSGSTGCGSTCGAGLEEIYPTTAVRYGAMSWIGEFAVPRGTVFRCGAHVVIQSDRGIELGQQVSLFCDGCNKHISRAQVKAYVEQSGAEFYRLQTGEILREATAEDISEHLHLNAHMREDIVFCALLAAQLSLDLKVITAEHLLGGERIVFYFRAESRVDFRHLVKELAQRYQTRIEMRQVGARDEARLVADYEICGRECCCKNFLKKLRPVNMKMAKLQKSTLDPTKVSGRCGRLRCCLRYEHEGYEALAAKLPAVGSRVGTDSGPATVVDRQVLTQLLLVRTGNDREITIPLEEIRAFNLPKPPPAETPTEQAEPPTERARARHERRSREQEFAPRAAETLEVANQEAPDASGPGSAGVPPADRVAQRQPQSEPAPAGMEPEPEGPRRARRRSRRQRGAEPGTLRPEGATAAPAETCEEGPATPADAPKVPPDTSAADVGTGSVSPDEADDDTSAKMPADDQPSATEQGLGESRSAPQADGMRPAPNATTPSRRRGRRRRRRPRRPNAPPTNGAAQGR